MAIIPIQIKTVFSIGQSHGVDLDQGYQGVHRGGRRGLDISILGAVWAQVAGQGAAGKTFGKIGSAATGLAFSLAL